MSMEGETERGRGDVMEGDVMVMEGERVRNGNRGYVMEIEYTFYRGYVKEIEGT